MCVGTQIPMTKITQKNILHPQCCNTITFICAIDNSLAVEKKLGRKWRINYQGKHHYNVHLAMFVFVLISLRHSWRRCCVGSGFLCLYSLQTQRRHCENHPFSAGTAGGEHAKKKKRCNNRIPLFLLLLLLHCASLSMGLFLVLQLVFRQTPLGDSGQLLREVLWDKSNLLLFNHNFLQRINPNYPEWHDCSGVARFN